MEKTADRQVGAGKFIHLWKSPHTQTFEPYLSEYFIAINLLPYTCTSVACFRTPPVALSSSPRLLLSLLSLMVFRSEHEGLSTCACSHFSNQPIIIKHTLTLTQLNRTPWQWHTIFLHLPFFPNSFGIVQSINCWKRREFAVPSNQTR
jgi:hypothetical protein